MVSLSDLKDSLACFPLEVARLMVMRTQEETGLRIRNAIKNLQYITSTAFIWSRTPEDSDFWAHVFMYFRHTKGNGGYEFHLRYQNDISVFPTTPMYHFRLRE
jgi:hypothetical protein